MLCGHYDHMFANGGLSNIHGSALSITVAFRRKEVLDDGYLFSPYLACKLSWLGLANASRSACSLDLQVTPRPPMCRDPKPAFKGHHVQLRRPFNAPSTSPASVVFCYCMQISGILSTRITAVQHLVLLLALIVIAHAADSSLRWSGCAPSCGN